MESARAGTRSDSWRRSLQWWPSLLGAALAAVIAYDLSGGSELAPVVALSGLIYLGTAILQKPSWAWAVLLLSLAIASAASSLTGAGVICIFLGLAGLIILAALLLGASRRPAGFGLQVLAMAALGAVAIVALRVDGKMGTSLVAAGLLVHAGWDFHHHRVNRIVARSFAEFCFVLDTLLALAIIIALLAQPARSGSSAEQRSTMLRHTVSGTDVRPGWRGVARYLSPGGGRAADGGTAPPVSGGMALGGRDARARPFHQRGSSAKRALRHGRGANAG